MTRPIVYISGPLSNGDREANIRRAEDAAFRLIREGFAVICTHSHARRTEAWDISHEVWLAQDRPLVRACDVLLALDGYSPGGDIERGWAAAEEIPVYHDIEELIEDRDLFVWQDSGGEDDD